MVGLVEVMEVMEVEMMKMEEMKELMMMRRREKKKMRKMRKRREMKMKLKMKMKVDSGGRDGGGDGGDDRDGGGGGGNHFYPDSLEGRGEAIEYGKGVWGHVGSFKEPAKPHNDGRADDMKNKGLGPRGLVLLASGVAVLSIPIKKLITDLLHEDWLSF